MTRWGMLGAVSVIAGAALGTGASDPPRLADEAPAPRPKTGTVVGQKIGFFNMPKVMRDYQRVRESFAELNERKARLSANLVGLRAMHDTLGRPGKSTFVAPDGSLVVPVAEIGPRAGGSPEVVPASATNPGDVILLARLIEDTDREINKLLNDQTPVITSRLYDDIYAAAVEVAKEHGLSALLAYPDAVTEEERNNPFIKELKLKPPAAQPFFLDAGADYTDELLRRLNAKAAAKRPDNPPRFGDGKVVGQKTGFFNMAGVMRDYKKAIDEVKGLNEKRTEMSRDLVGWRDRYIKLQADVQKQADPEEKEAMAKEMLQLARKIEDKDREVNKILNDRATEIISQLYDDVHAVVSEVARENGLSAVLAYPDAVTPEERNSATVKELKLKPPAAQPFYLDPSVDYTAEVIRRLNARYAAGGK